MPGYGSAPYAGAPYAGAHASVTGTLGVIFNTILDPSQVPVPNVPVRAKLMPTAGFRLSLPLSEVAREVTTTSNASGYWELPLDAHLNITPALTYYEIVEDIPDVDGGRRVWTVRATANQALSVSAARITP